MKDSEWPPDPVQKKQIPTVMPALDASEIARDSDGKLFQRLVSVKDFAGSVLL